MRGDRMRIMLNPVALPNKLPPRIGKGPAMVIFIGRMNAKKGTFDLLRGFASLADKNARLILAGDGEIEQTRSLARELGIENRVSIYSWLKHEQVLQYL